MGEFYQVKWKCDKWYCFYGVNGEFGYDETSCIEAVPLYCPKCGRRKTVEWLSIPFKGVDKEEFEKLSKCNNCSETMIPLYITKDSSYLCPRCKKGHLKPTKIVFDYQT